MMLLEAYMIAAGLVWYGLLMIFVYSDPTDEVDYLRNWVFYPVLAFVAMCFPLHAVVLIVRKHNRPLYERWFKKVS